MIPLLASFLNLEGPDFIVIAIILFVLLGIPALIALPIIFIVTRRSKKPLRMSKKEEMAKRFELAAKDGTLLTTKHDPSGLSATHSQQRTVVAADLAPKLPEFFQSLDFEITHYENTSYPKTPDYWEVRPTNPTFSVPASGVPAYSPTPTTQCDRLVVVSGSQQGLHVFGESSAEIQRRVRAGELRNPQQL